MIHTECYSQTTFDSILASIQLSKIFLLTYHAVVPIFRENVARCNLISFTKWSIFTNSLVHKSGFSADDLGWFNSVPTSAQ